MKPNSISTGEGLKHFWSKVNVKGPDDCWLWRSGKDKDGYGRFKLEGKNNGAHRVAYRISTGIDPGKYVVMHSCDTPSCCNPNHLERGTVLQNNSDRSAKGRSNPLRGESVKTSNLTADTVVAIRELYAEGGHTIYSIAEQYGVNPQQVHVLIRGKTWRTAGGPIQRKKEHLIAKLTDKQVAAIRREYIGERGQQRRLAEKYGVTQPTISLIVRNKYRV